jgi:hypothetical protein
MIIGQAVGLEESQRKRNWIRADFENFEGSSNPIFPRKVESNMGSDGKGATSGRSLFPLKPDARRHAQFSQSKLEFFPITMPEQYRRRASFRIAANLT